MSDTQFFTRGRSKGNERRILLSSFTCLVGKAPTKAKRLKLKIRMYLTGQKMTGMPEWIANAMTFVAKSHDIVTLQNDLSGFEIAFSDDSLFAKEVLANKCDLRKFVIMETWPSEEPDVEMQFVIYAPFTKSLWNWCGQYAGEEFWAEFTAVAVEEAAGGDLELTGDDETEEEETGDEEQGS